MSKASILIVEDEILIARDLEYLLEDLGYTIPLIATTSDEALSAILTLQPDLVLLDIHLANGSDGLAVAEWLREHTDTPVVFLTAHADAPTIARAQATSPYGYLLKPFNERELAIAVQLVLAKSASDRLLRTNERLFATTLRSIADGVIVTDTSNQITYLNPRAEQITGWSSHEALGQLLPAIFLLQDAVLAQTLAPKAASLEDAPALVVADQLLVLRDGALRPVEDTIAPIADERGATYGQVVVFRDVTERHLAEAARRRIEQKMFETQRLESLGILAGGIAHDFNNILTGVIGYAQLTADQLAPDSQANETLQQSMLGMGRAADLTAQLLAYTGHGQSVIRAVSLNTIMRELTGLLRGTIADHALLDLRLSESLPPVLGDVTQLNQVILNLLTNAVEAIGAECGSILVRTEQLQLTPAQTEGMLIRTGVYACVTVRDSGCGMSPEILAKIFDPFYTTKFTGRGLGLAAVQGIVRGHAGAIKVTSAPGEGTTFQVYLPVADVPIVLARPLENVPPRVESRFSAQQKEHSTLLLIDDEPEVRSVMSRMLEYMGFQVYAVADGASGLARLASDLPPIAGIFLDLTMPGISGFDLITAIQQLCPAMPIVVMSGYHAAETAARYSQLRPRCFLQKPFTRAALEAALARLLGPE